MKDELQNEGILHCGVCFKENDQTSRKLIDWVQCDVCEVWSHRACIEYIF